MNVVEVGDKIQNYRGLCAIVDSVDAGKHGLLVYGTFESGSWFGEYQPYELPPCEREEPFYNWIARSSTTLASGLQVGCVAWIILDGKLTLEDCEARWQHTLETMRLEKMSGTHTPDNTLQSRPFTEQSRPDVL